MKLDLSKLKAESYISENMSNDLLDLNFQHSFNGRNDKFKVFNNENFKKGKNLLINRLTGKHDRYSWLNLKFNSYKIKCKTLFLS